MNNYKLHLSYLSIMLLFSYLSFEIGWLNGAKFLQIDATMASASTCYVSLVESDVSGNGLRKILLANLSDAIDDTKNIINEYNDPFGIYIKTLFDHHDSYSDVINVMEQYLSQIDSIDS